MSRAPDWLPDPNARRIPTLRQARESLEPPGIWRHDPADVRALLKARGDIDADNGVYVSNRSLLARPAPRSHRARRQAMNRTLDALAGGAMLAAFFFLMLWSLYQ